jgi:hypothetical protein
VLRLTFFSFSFHNCLSLFRFSLSIPSFWLRLFRQSFKIMSRALSLSLYSLVIWLYFQLFPYFLVS